VASLVTVGAGAVLGGCSSPAVPTIPPSSVAAPSDRDRLAGLAAAANDRRYIASYDLHTTGHPDRLVTVAVATDGSWVVAVPESALSGAGNVAIYYASDVLYQCLLSATDGFDAGCSVAAPLTAPFDPQVQHIFTDWIEPLTDRATALSVTAVPATTVPGASGSCFSVESTSAALAPPVDPGTYCYDPSGILTAASVAFGSLALSGPVTAAPPSVALPAPTVSRQPVPITAP
jgi:hypothetical protein